MYSYPAAQSDGEQHRYPYGFEVPGSNKVAQGIHAFILFGCVSQNGYRRAPTDPD